MSGFSLVELTLALALLAAAAAATGGQALVRSARTEPARPDEDVAIRLASVLTSGREDAIHDAQRVRVRVDAADGAHPPEDASILAQHYWTIDRGALAASPVSGWTRLDRGALGDEDVQVESVGRAAVVHFDETGAIGLNDARAFVVKDPQTGQESRVEIFASGKVCVMARAQEPLRRAGVAACPLV